MAIYFHWTGSSIDLWQSVLQEMGIESPFYTSDQTFDPAEIEYAIAWAPPAGQLSRFDNLRYVFSVGAGVTHITEDPTFNPEIPVVRLQDDMLVQDMSGHILHWALHFHRHYHRYAQYQRQKKWLRHGYPENSERRIAILGLGQTGLDACVRLRDLGFSVTGWSQSPKTLDGVTCLHGDAALQTVVSGADILVNLLPLTPKTTDLLNKAVFDKMPAGGFVINCSRGASITDEDLIAALDSGHLEAAALDVFRTEPLPEDSPYWMRPDVHVTPHAAAPTNEKSAARFILGNIRKVLDGGIPAPIVDLSRGY
ncbi:glyoxylate/hydroxypyruvate reductase A [Shimia gijangensis]|uniref:Glyoxylate/hydroxypyruvate reductase A n=1 Tax=Shimia gijangensis TaxID=1470563 RepID=A0A1M6CFB2_9RHOB|nr:glyoxylate/hydroxypyruvate reductase A [Shimia gijangensis]SHI59682.1 glyoxylate/hydroxypyruvate reductase A [Shimia gijangensis]